MLLVLASEAVNDPRSPSHPRPGLSTFPLIAQSIITYGQFPVLVNLFFSKMHFFFPMVPFNRIPRTPEDMARFAAEEQDLASVIMIISSRYMNEDGYAGLHERCWAWFKVCSLLF